MTRPIILPYDGSPVARASLRELGRVIRTHGARAGYDGVIVATAGVDPAELETLTAEAQSIAGRDVTLQVHLLNAGDPIGALHELAASLPDVVLAAPMHARGRAAWYGAACVLGGLPYTLMLLFIHPSKLKPFEAPAPEPRHADARPRWSVWRVPSLVLGVTRQARPSSRRASSRSVRV